MASPRTPRPPPRLREDESRRGAATVHPPHCQVTEREESDDEKFQTQLLLNLNASSGNVWHVFCHLAVCGWTVASPSLRPRRFPRGTRRRRDVHETLLSILILVQLCVNHPNRAGACDVTGLPSQSHDSSEEPFPGGKLVSNRRQNPWHHRPSARRPRHRSRR